VLSLCLALSTAHALDPNKRLTQYAHTAWRIQDGFFPNAPYSISQTKDGYLWVGGNSGGLRFDGVRFTPWSAPLASTPVLHPFSVRAGDFWIATRSEIAHVRDNVVISHYDVPVNSMYKASDGSIWTLSSQNPDRILCQATDAKIRCFGKAEGITIHMPFSFLPDGKGGFWIGGDTSLLHWKMGAAPEIYSPQHLQSNVGQIGIRSLLEDSDGSLLVGIMAAGPGLGLERFRNGVLTPVVLPNFDGSKLFVHGIMKDSDKNIWIATFGNGIYRIHGQTVDHFGRADGLSSDSVSDLGEGDDGTVWAATTDGLDNFRDLPVTTFSTATGPGPTGAASVMATKDGTVWVANLGTLDFVRNGTVSSVRVPGQQVSSLLEDHRGNIWVGVDDGLFIYKDGRFRRIPEPDHRPLGLVLGITEDVDGNIWAECKGAQERRLIRIRDFKVREEFSQPQVPKSKAIAADPKGGIWLGAVTGELTFFREGIVHASPLKLKRGSWAYQIVVAPDGSVLTASDDGLVMLRDGKVQRLGKENGLPCDGVNGFVVDDNKNLWLGTPCGFMEIAGADVQRWWIHPDTVVRARLFDTLDGALPGRVSFNPAAKSPDGRLWFVNGTVLQMIDPSHLSGNGTVSPVYVETVVADRKQYEPQGLQLPPLTRDLEIVYTSPSFLIPQKVKFRYKLDGHDRDWQDAGTRREAFYTDLGPGKYRFRVVASNNGGVWNEQGATLDFVIAPAFYQTVWFRSLVGVLFLAVLTGLYRLRLRHLERQRDALRKSEKELRDVIDTIPAIVWSTVPDGSNTYVNKRYVEYTGLSTEQVAGSGWKALIHPDDLEQHAAKWTQAIATGKPHESEVRSRRSDGQYRWQLDRGVPLRDEDGNIVKWYGVTTDIEDRKRAEEALRLVSSDLQDSKAKLEEAQRIAHVGYWERDIRTDRISWSDETYRIFGLQPQEDLIDLVALREKIHPEDREYMCRALEEALGGGTRYNIDYRVLRPTGEVRIVHSNGDVTRDASGRPYKMFGTVQDITDRKRAEEILELMSRDVQESKTRLEEAQRIAHVGHWIWDIGKDDLTWSDETYRIFGLRPQERPMNVAAFQEMIHPEDRDFLFRATQEARDGGRPDVEFRIVRPSGEVRNVHSQGAVTRDASGRPRQRFGAIQDITDRKRAHEELRRNQFYLSEGQRLANMGSWAFNPSGFFEYWSQELFKIYGLDPQKGAPTRDEYLATLHPQDRDCMANTIKRMCAERTGCDVKKRIVRPDGELRYIRCVGIPVVEGEVLKGFLGTAIDVTEQELQTQELERRRAYLAEAQRLSHTGSFGWNVSSGEIYWSEETYNIFEYDRVVKPMLELVLQRVHPDDRGLVQRALDRASQARADFDFEHRLLMPDGSVKHLQVSARVSETSSGDLQYMGAVTDFTERKRAEVLRDDESRILEMIARDALLQEILENLVRVVEAQFAGLLCSVLFLDEDGQHVSHAAAPSLPKPYVEAINGLSIGPQAGSCGTAMYRGEPVVVTDILQDPLWESYRAVAEPHGLRACWSTPILSHSGKVLGSFAMYYREPRSPSPSENHALEMATHLAGIAIERKLTRERLQRSEAYLTEAQKLTHTGSWAWRSPGRRAMPVHISEEFYRIYGFDPAEGAPTLEEYIERIHPEDRLTWTGEFERAIVQKADYDHEFRILLPNGTVKWIRTVGHPVLSDAGDLGQFVGSSTDITELKSAEQEREKLRQLEADLAHINRVSTLGEMAASLAHEIKQPIAAAITSANSCIEWLAHEPPNLDRARLAAARIDKYGNRAAEIIDRMRSFYKKSPPQRELVGVNGIIQEMLTLLEGEATRHSIAMHTDLSAKLPKIMVDRVQLQQVFMNLMLNAIEAMKDSGGELTVKSELQDGHLQFSVSDKGVGLPTEKMDQIFSAFFTTKTQGSGMGLAISRSIVESHGGRLWATANAGRGATFHFILPIQVTESSHLVA
jgi:PAS domain S-box-containing protein